MIAFVRGTAVYADNESIIIDNHGIGYRVRTSSRTLSSAVPGRECTLYTYLYVREDVMALYGFETREELTVFSTLLGIGGIGPRAAISVLSTLTVEELYYAVFSDDVKTISRTPGIGPKGARRMIMELKDKLKLDDLDSVREGVSGSDSGAGPADTAGSDSQMIDTIDALVALGYSNGEAYRAVHKVNGAREMDTGELLKKALEIISRGV